MHVVFLSVMYVHEKARQEYVTVRSFIPLVICAASFTFLDRRNVGNACYKPWAVTA